MARVTHLDLANLTIREVNQFLHHELDASQTAQVDIQNPDGKHSIAAGLDVDVTVNILGHAGYFVAGMNKQASVTIHGNVGWSVAENAPFASGGNYSLEGTTGHREWRYRQRRSNAVEWARRQHDEC